MCHAKLPSFEWFRAGTESQIRLLPYAGKPEADLMLTSHTFIANPVCTGCLTLNCRGRRRGSACSPGCDASSCVATQPPTSVWRGTHTLPLAFASSFAPPWPLRYWQIRDGNVTDGKKTAEVSPSPTVFYLSEKKKKCQCGFRALDVWAAPFFWSYSVFQCHWDK